MSQSQRSGVAPPLPAPLPDAEPLKPKPPAAESRPRRRLWAVGVVLLVLLLLVILPPFLSLSRYQRRIVTSMSDVLGRPVHLDHVSLNLLPLPSFTITNLVIEELPPFGAEPIIRANTVRARLRVSSLWRHRVEFSRITFTDPSVNLVRNPDGRWNLEGVLLQAARINAAPTGQPRAGGPPRFPYIEATGARVNLKLDRQKTPFSLTEAAFALWLPQPQQWRLRLRGRPARTDTSASDTGILQAEATLERAGSAGQVPLSLDAGWTGVPLGEASRVLTGSDAGLRGGLTLTSHLAGTLDHAALELELKLNGLHRIDLVPDRPVDVDLHCSATTARLLHSLAALRCQWPLAGSEGGQLTLDGSVPNLLAPSTADLALAADHIPAESLLRWAHAATGHLAPDLRAAGELSGTLTYPGATSPARAQLALTGLALSGGHLGAIPVRFGPIHLLGATPRASSLGGLSVSLAPTTAAFSPAAAREAAASTEPSSAPEDQASTPPESGAAMLSGLADTNGYTAHLAGLVPLSRLLALGADLPGFAGNLAQVLPSNRASGPTRVDLAVRRSWGATARWTDNLAPPPPSPTKSARHPHRHHRR